jgi:hypothetical protein
MEMFVSRENVITKHASLTTRHNGEDVVWDVSNYNKDNFGDSGDVCSHINNYWATLPVNTQYEIFDIFKQIRYVLEDTYDTTEMIKSIIPLVTKLYMHHPLEEMMHWVVWKSDIIIPEKFLDAYIVDDMKPGNRAKTYTKPDYTGLVVLALQLRLMVPIWGEFIFRTKPDTGTHYKEFHAFQLLTSSALMNSEPMLKLITYVNSNIQADKSINGAVLSGIGTEDYPRWLLSLVTVRRLCVGDFTGSNPDTSLVTFMYNFIFSKTASAGGPSFGSIVKDKPFDTAQSASDNNASRTEGYKIKQDIATGDIAIIEHYVSNPYTLAAKLSIDKSLLDLTLTSCSKLTTSTIERSHVSLVSWILASIVPPRSLPHFSKLNVIKCIAVCQAWLWQNNHNVLSLLISATATNNSNEMQLSGLDSRARIAIEQMEILKKIYPFATVNSTKQKTKPTNHAVAAIDIVCSQLSQRDWILTAPKQHIAQTLGQDTNMRFSCPHDIKILLANLIISLKQDTVNKLANNETFKL